MGCWRETPPRHASSPMLSPGLRRDWKPHQSPGCSCPPLPPAALEIAAHCSSGQQLVQHKGRLGLTLTMCSGAHSLVPVALTWVQPTQVS